MILTCPSCETQYFADDATIGESGRTVKCAACSHAWFVSPKGETNHASAPRAGAHEAYRDKVRERRRKASRSAAVMAWLIVGTIFGASVAAGVIFRDRVVEYWPESAAAFRAAGLDVNRYGLEFVDTEAERYFEGTTPVLEIEGQVQNISRRERAAPFVRVMLLDETGGYIGASFAPITPERIPPGRTASFSTRVENPPFEAFELELQFSNDRQSGPAGDKGSDMATGGETE
ncbi:MJ0042-type zinc finger domain-containing protein [Henriciella sp.]|uniref:MJ0042-type zinc finger domain-containing protein n=1 Tax=Henriciella sp. TaxID=1968823 RepID=UPI00263398B9|nr:MJ0042-type zinc finger domain-containing protein [Henriciella sp.]